jgi:hypothetical protein
VQPHEPFEQTKPDASAEQSLLQLPQWAVELSS